MVVREHREKLSDVRVEEGEAVGRWLGVVSRAVVGAVKEDERGGVEEGEGEDVDVGDWNVVQNNGMLPLCCICDLEWVHGTTIADSKVLQAHVQPKLFPMFIFISYRASAMSLRLRRGAGRCLGRGRERSWMRMMRLCWLRG